MRFVSPLLFLLLALYLCGCQPDPSERTATVPATAVALPTPLATPTTTPLPPPAATAVPTRTPIPPTPTPAFPVYDGPPLSRNLIGVQLHLRQEDQDALFAHLDALGVGWVKVQISWKLYEPVAGQYEPDRFAELDQFVATAGAHHIQVLLSVSKAPEWSRPTTELDGPPSDFSLYQRFMSDLARRYQGRVAAYELWNEANLQREWNGFPLDGALFVDLIRAGARGVANGDPAAVRIAGAPAVTGINDRLNAIDDRVFLGEMLATGVLDSVEAIAAHPYGFANPPDSSVAQPDTAVPSHNNHPSFFFQDTMTDYRALLTQFGAADVPLWATEFGWGSFEGIKQANGQPAPPVAGTEYMNDVSEWQQAVYTLRAYELAQSWPATGPLILWNLNFGPLLGTQFSETGYSLLRPDGSERPLYLSLAHAPKTQ